MSLLLLFAATVTEAPFEPSAATFADAAACRAELDRMAGAARGGDYDAVEGPYEIAAGDIRIHTVRAAGTGHLIAEHRCLAEKLSGRSWTHAMAEAEPEFTVESVVRTAAWLKKEAPQQ